MEQASIDQLSEDSWKLRNLSENTIFQMLGIYSLSERGPDDILMLFQLMQNKNESANNLIEPDQERPEGQYFSEESISPKGVASALNTVLNYGIQVWSNYSPKIKTLVCNADGTCKYKIGIIDDLKDLIILITGALNIGCGIAACLVLILYKKGYARFCET